MRIERRFTVEGQSAYTGVEFRKTTSEIRNPDGSIVFRMEDLDVPAGWSQGNFFPQFFEEHRK